MPPLIHLGVEDSKLSTHVMTMKLPDMKSNANQTLQGELYHNEGQQHQR